MQNQKIIISIVSVICMAILLIVGGYYFLLVKDLKSTVSPAKNAALKQPTQQKIVPPITPPDSAKQQEIINTNYPQVITGTIQFLDVKNVFKTTLKTADGTVYTLWPAQPEAVYKSFGATNGGKVQLNGKPLKDGKLSWILMKPI